MSVSSRGTGISDPDLCTLHLSPLYHLEEVIEEVETGISVVMSHGSTYLCEVVVVFNLILMPP
jgi:hypothetical protein